MALKLGRCLIARLDPSNSWGRRGTLEVRLLARLEKRIERQVVLEIQQATQDYLVDTILETDEALLPDDELLASFSPPGSL